MIIFCGSLITHNIYYIHNQLRFRDGGLYFSKVDVASSYSMTPCIGLTTKRLATYETAEGEVGQIGVLPCLGSQVTKKAHK